MSKPSRRDVLASGAVAAAGVAAMASVGRSAEAATLTDTGEHSLLFDNCSALQTKVLVGNNETLILANAYMALNKFPVADTDQAIVVSGAVYLIPGANCKAVCLRLRRGYGITGAIDYEIGAPADGGLYLPPGRQGVIPVAGIMNPTVYIPGPGQYSVTVQQLSATGNAKLIYASLAFTYVGFNH